MKRFPVNPDFVKRYSFAALVFAGLGGWFAYDGYFVYPATSAAALYEKIEKSAPAPEMTAERLEAFKARKIKSQHGLALALIALAGGVGAVLFRAFRFDFDPESCGKILSVDRSKWKTKGVLILETERRGRVVLDGFHHLGVPEFERTLL